MDCPLAILLYATTAFLAALEGLLLWKMATDRLDLRAFFTAIRKAAALLALELDEERLSAMESLAASSG